MSKSVAWKCSSCRREAREVAERSTAILSCVCDADTEATRRVLEKQEDFKQQLGLYLARHEDPACRSMLEVRQ